MLLTLCMNEIECAVITPDLDLNKAEKHLAKTITELKEYWQEQAYAEGKEDADFLNNQFDRP